jgi:rubrerythrin
VSVPGWLRAFDRDGAIAETRASSGAVSRAQALRLGAAVAGAVLASQARLPSAAAASSSGAGDVAILNYALTLEEVQAAFYSEAERAGALQDALAEQARIVGAHERAHVKAFRAVLGARAIGKPTFDFRGQTEDSEGFRKTAVAFEDLAVAAYQDQIPLLAAREYVAAAVAIHSVEARHAAWIRRLAGVLPASKPFDEPLPKADVTRLVASTHFIVAAPRTAARRPPRYTG